MTKRLLSKSEVRNRVKLSFTEIARREDREEFPKRIALGPYRTSRRVWIEEEIDAWIADQIERYRRPA